MKLIFPQQYDPSKSQIMKRLLMLLWPRGTHLLRVSIVPLLLLSFASNFVVAEEISRPLEGYSSFPEVEARLRTLNESPVADLVSLGQTLGERDIWLLTVSEDPGATKPAIVVLGNVVGSHLLGRELALGMAEIIVHNADSDPAMADLLSRFTIYFIPSPTPDASEKNFQSPSRKHDGNLTPTDDDHDFTFGEDPPQDLNRDGFITMMRVAEPFGTHRTHPNDPRILIPVDKKKGEIGEYRIHIESLDSDLDENFGEDGSDGVDFNRNFTFNYEFFGKSAGPHQVSERETRAVADFLFDHPNVAAVFCFSPEDNLFHPWKGSPQSDAARVKTKVLTDDQRFLDRLSEAYRKLHGGKSAPQPPSGAGSFSEWSYFHFGRWTFAARGWWIPPAAPERGKDEGSQDEGSHSEEPSSTEQAASETPVEAPESNSSSGQEDSGQEDDAKTKQEPEADQPTEPSDTATSEDTSQDNTKNATESSTDSPVSSDEPSQATATDETLSQSDSQPAPPKNPPLAKDDKRGTDELNALAWFKSQGVEAFIEWQPHEHPDFPGKQVEIGGFKPHAMLNPPSQLIAPLVKPHVEFLKEIAKQLPTIEIRDVKIEVLGPGIVDISCSVVNVGQMPTMPVMGSTNRQWYPIQVELAGVDAVRWIEGSPRQSVGRLSELGGSQTLRWVFIAKELPKDSHELTISAYAPTLHPTEAKVQILTGSP